MHLEYGAFSHQGMVRKCNEDYLFIPQEGSPLKRLVMVADGMGGHNAGDIASQMVVESILDYYNENINDILDEDDAKDAIHQAIQQANHKVFQHSRTDLQLAGMGTTLTLVYFLEGKVCVGHVGDSRGYWIGGQTLRQITRDHSLVQELLENGSITQEEVSSHPQRNVITRALGTEEYVKIDYYEMSMEHGDIILLCTDGLLHHVSLEENMDLLTSNRSLDQIAELLGKKALEGGGIDNITVVMVKYSDMAEKR